MDNETRLENLRDKYYHLAEEVAINEGVLDMTLDDDIPDAIDDWLADQEDTIDLLDRMLAIKTKNNV